MDVKHPTSTILNCCLSHFFVLFSCQFVKDPMDIALLTATGPPLTNKGFHNGLASVVLLAGIHGQTDLTVERVADVNSMILTSHAGLATTRILRDSRTRIRTPTPSPRPLPPFHPSRYCCSARESGSALTENAPMLTVVLTNPVKRLIVAYHVTCLDGCTYLLSSRCAYGRIVCSSLVNFDLAVGRAIWRRGGGGGGGGGEGLNYDGCSHWKSLPLVWCAPGSASPSTPCRLTPWRSPTRDVTAVWPRTSTVRNGPTSPSPSKVRHFYFCL